MSAPLRRDELLALARTQLTVDLGTAARAWGIGKTKGYELARADALPFPVRRLGGVYRVPLDGLLRSLALIPPQGEAALLAAEVTKHERPA